MKCANFGHEKSWNFNAGKLWEPWNCSWQLIMVSAVDKLSTRVLKDAFLSLVDQLTFTFNLSLKKGVFPDKWKATTIIPLQKDGNKEDVSNLRPVSLLPLPGKLLEKLVHKQLNTYLENHQLLSDCQGGFQQGHSTISKITELTDDLYKAMDSRETTVSVFIDFRKAFDTVIHNILLNKLELLGIKGLNKIWFESYLTNRTQRTLANGVISNPELITCGVPQGSTLGPLLFLIYINDLVTVVNNSELHLYADDTAVYCSDRHPLVAKNAVQMDLHNISRWCNNNKISINLKKTKSVIFGTRYMLKKFSNPKIELEGMVLENVGHYKYLGINLDSTLNFNKHMNCLLKTVSHKLFLLSKIRKFITKAAALRIYNVMVLLPYIDYGDIVYAGATTNSLNKTRGCKIEH